MKKYCTQNSSRMLFSLAESLDSFGEIEITFIPSPSSFFNSQKVFLFPKEICGYEKDYTTTSPYSQSFGLHLLPK